MVYQFKAQVADFGNFNMGLVSGLWQPFPIFFPKYFHAIPLTIVNHTPLLKIISEGDTKKNSSSRFLDPKSLVQGRKHVSKFHPWLQKLLILFKSDTGLNAKFLYVFACDSSWSILASISQKCFFIAKSTWTMW